MERIRIHRHKVPGERPWREALPPDPRDPDVVRAQARARAAAKPAEERAADRSTRRGITWSSAGMPTN